MLGAVTVVHERHGLVQGYLQDAVTLRVGQLGKVPAGLQHRCAPLSSMSMMLSYLASQSEAQIPSTHRDDLAVASVDLLSLPSGTLWRTRAES